MASIHEQCVDAVVAVLTAVLTAEPSSLSGARAVYKRELPATAPILFPALLVAVDRYGEEAEEFSTEEDERKFGIAVHFLDRRPADDGSKFWDWLSARQEVLSLFLVQTLAVTGCWDVRCRPLSLPEAKRTAGPAFQDSRGGLMLLARMITARRRV